MKEKYLNYLYEKVINENYKTLFKEIESVKKDKVFFMTREKIDIFFYTKNKNNSLKNELSIHLKEKTKISESPRVGLNKLLKRKINQQIVNKCNYIHIFINEIDHYGMLHVETRDKFIEKIVNTLITGIPMFKNFK
jgi:hypothetical protein